MIIPRRMLAAIYARKSTEQNRVSDQEAA